MKTLHLTLISILLACVTLGGCAGTDLRSLRPAKSKSTLVLVEPFAYEEFYSSVGNKFQYTLAKGEYKAMYEDDSGTYYAGPAKCLKIELVSTQSESQKEAVGKPNFLRCGIYAANKSESDPKIYFFKYSMADLAAANQVVGSNVANSSVTPAQAGVAGGVAMGIVSALDEAETKNLHFFKTQPQGNSLSLAIKRQ